MYLLCVSRCVLNYMSDLLQFEFASVNRQAEKLQVVHQSSAITPAVLVPLPQEDAAR
jgi:hypothetical protein